MVFAFVILHYGSSNVTQEAIDSVMRLHHDDGCVKIVVVDNASPDGTGTEVQEKNKANPNIFFIKNESNLGFARGNNRGFIFAKEQLNADFIILMNNDSVVSSADFCDLVIEDYTKEKFAVLGPKIVTPCGFNQNPLRKKMLKGFRLKLTQAYLWLDMLLTLLFVAPVLSSIFSKNKKRVSQENLTPINGVELHGSFMIFSPQYIQKFDGLDDRTFMYCEEEFLFARCIANGLKTRYNPSIEILHNEIESSHSDVRKKRTKALFRIRNCQESLAIYSRYIKNIH